MKLHYFDQEIADKDDIMLDLAIMQEYVPKTCLLGGQTVMFEISQGENPCYGCEGPREKCGGTIKRDSMKGTGLQYV